VASISDRPQQKLTGWVSQLYGQQLESKPRTSPDQIPTSRAFFSIGNFPRLLEDLPEGVTQTNDIVLWHRDGYDVTADVYAPEADGTFPTIVWFHGGSWSLMTKEFLRKLGMQWAAQGFVVLSVDYGLAPEFPFPHAPEDAIYALRWATKHIADHKGRPDHFFVGGDSAGANLTAAAILTLNDTTGALFDGFDQGDLADTPVSFAGALLFCGVFDFPLLFAKPGGLAATGFIETTWNLAYLGPNFVNLHRDPRVSAAYAPNLDSFPPSYLNVGIEDSLLPQSLSFTQVLADHGVDATLSVVGGADHEFLLMPDVVPEASAEFDRTVDWLHRHTVTEQSTGAAH
jgi:acetyl esterase/lipase